MKLVLMLALLPLLFGCAAGEANRPPLARADVASEPSRRETATDLRVSTPGHTGERVDHIDSVEAARLRAVVRELAQSPFGTGAVLSIGIDGRTTSIAAGTLWEDGPAATAQSRFGWASVSKLLTAARILALVHEGRLTLDDSVRQHLQGVRMLDTNGRDHAGELTLRQLLLHRAGLPHQPSAGDVTRLGSDWTSPALLQELTAGWGIDLAGRPGSYRYSNIGYVLLGAIIEKLEGETFSEAMEPYLRGLSMTGATFWPPTDGAAHGVVIQDGVATFHPPGWYTSRYGLPFTGLWATPADLVLFGEALIAANSNSDSPLHPMTQLASGMGHGLGPVHRRRFGLQSLEHDGAGPGFVSWFVAIPDRNLVLAVAWNANGESAEIARRFAAALDEILRIILDPDAEPGMASDRPDERPVDD